MSEALEVLKQPIVYQQKIKSDESNIFERGPHIEIKFKLKVRKGCYISLCIKLHTLDGAISRKSSGLVNLFEGSLIPFLRGLTSVGPVLSSPLVFDLILVSGMYLAWFIISCMVHLTVMR